MKKKLKIIIPAAALLCIAFWLFDPFTFKLPKYKLPEDNIKISVTYNDDTLIALCSKSFRKYDAHGETTVVIPSEYSYSDLCAVSSDDIMFLDLNGNVIHYVNGNFDETNYHNIKSVCYVVGSYLFLDGDGNVYNEDGLICTLDNAEKLLGSPEADFALKNIMYSDGTDLYNYSIRSDETECLENCTEAEINMCGAMAAADGKLFGFFPPERKFKETEYGKNAEITHITSRIHGQGYLILNKSGKIEALGLDSDGNIIKERKISSTGDHSFSYYNPLRNELSYCQGYVRLVNGITSVDNIYSSPQGGLHINQQLIFIQSGNNIFLYY